MIKFFCDRCGKEIDDIVNSFKGEIIAKDSFGNKLLKFCENEYHLCDKCNEAFKILPLEISDFIHLSDRELDKELDISRYIFNVGDEVITSTGEVGTITDVCTCDFCAERGFYEPRVKTLIGTGTIYITDIDKNNSFKNFYKIGQYTFGNLDRDSVEYDIVRTKQRLKNLHNELEIYTQQLNNIKHFEKKRRGE